MQPDKSLTPRRVAALFLCALLIMNIISAAEAQSGRRPPKRPTSPDPIPPAQSEPPIVPPSTQPKPAGTPILLAKDLYDLIYSSDIFLGDVVDGFMERMQKVPAVKARASARRTNRKEAIDAAKGSEDTYVVWFQLRNESAASAPSDVRYGDSLYVEYSIFMPGTGKSKTSGHIYQRDRRGVLGTPLPSPRGGSTVEYSLRYAGMELAERVLDSLNLLTTPPIH